MLKTGLSIQRVTCRKGKKKIRISCSDPNYSSNFTANTDGWAANLGIESIQGGVSINRVPGFLQVSFENSLTKLDDPSSFVKAGLNFTAGCTYNWELSYYINSANDEVTFVNEIVVGGVTVSVDSGAVATNTLITRTGTVTPTTADGKFFIFMNADNDTRISDVVGFKNINLYL